MSPISSRKNVPVSATSNSPGLSSDRAGERAALVAEQLGVEQVVVERRAVGDHELAIASLRADVDRARDQLLAGAVLALDQHGRVRRRDPVEQARRAPASRASAPMMPWYPVRCSGAVSAVARRGRAARWRRRARPRASISSISPSSGADSCGAITARPAPSGSSAEIAANAAGSCGRCATSVSSSSRRRSTPRTCRSTRRSSPDHHGGCTRAQCDKSSQPLARPLGATGPGETIRNQSPNQAPIRPPNQAGRSTHQRSAVAAVEPGLLVDIEVRDLQGDDLQAAARCRTWCRTSRECG